MKRSEKDFIVVGMVAIAATPGALAPLEIRLAEADRRRAARFRRLEDRARFVLGRALLARLLADELDYRPPILELALTEQGQPHLAAFPNVSFSISHAGEWVAVALAPGAQVGIDIEALDRRVDLDALAERIFHQADLARFRSVPEADKPRAFFRAWTGKEAVLKAKGLGLFGGVREISLPLDDTPAVVLDPTAPGTTWHVQPLAVSSGYVAALACNQPRPIPSPRLFSIAELG
jgi:4'-phosphopantetheinyl transferase